MIQPDLRSRQCPCVQAEGLLYGKGGAGECALWVRPWSPHTMAVTSHGGSYLTRRRSPHTVAVTSHRGGHLTPRRSRHNVTSHREVASHGGGHLTLRRSRLPTPPRFTQPPPPAPALLLWWRNGNEKQERSGRWKKPAPASPEAMPQLELPHKSLTSRRENPQLFTLTELTLTFCQVFFNLAQNNLSQVSIVLSWQILNCYSN